MSETIDRLFKSIHTDKQKITKRNDLFDFLFFRWLEPIYEISVSSFETHYLTELYFSAVLSSREYILEGAVNLVLSIPSRLSSDVYMRSLY